MPMMSLIARRTVVVATLGLVGATPASAQGRPPHACAEVTAALEPCRALAWFAAHAQDTLPEDAAAAANCAKAHLAEVGREVARAAIKVHGGTGFTDLAGRHFNFTRIGFDRQALGGPEICRHDAAVAQSGAAA